MAEQDIRLRPVRVRGGALQAGTTVMQVKFGDCVIELTQGDITRQQVDAIVNAANSHLAGGGGVDGAIHRAAGPAIMAETRQRYPDGCPTGSAVATSSGNLPVKNIFHAVGPRWRGGGKGERGLLKAAYRACLELAVEHNCDRIAFPAISTGAYGYPMDLAAEDSLAEVRDFLQEHRKPQLVRFVLFGEGALGAYSRALESLAS